MSKDLTYEQAEKLAVSEMNTLTKKEHEIVLWEEKTIEKSHYWVFVFASKKYIKTKDPKYTIFGLSSIIIEKDGTITKTPSSVSPTVFFEHFDKQIAVKYKEN